MSDDRDSSKFGLGLFIGALLGAIAGLFLAPRTGKETREEAKKMLDELKKRYRTGELKDKVRKIFGDVRKESIELYMTAKDEIGDKVREAKGKMNRQDFDRIVDEVTSRLRKAGKVTEEQMRKLKDDLVREWDRIKKETEKEM